MAARQTIARAFIGLILGAVAGGLVGLGLGLVYVEIAAVTSFEGYSGFTVVLWMVSGALIGAVTGVVMGIKRSRMT